MGDTKFLFFFNIVCLFFFQDFFCSSNKNFFWDWITSENIFIDSNFVQG